MQTCITVTNDTFHTVVKHVWIISKCCSNAIGDIWNDSEEYDNTFGPFFLLRVGFSTKAEKHKYNFQVFGSLFFLLIEYDGRNQREST